ncbi:hypothetical protein BJX62DRAFT_130967 [Aspergillus germanicus]
MMLQGIGVVNFATCEIIGLFLGLSLVASLLKLLERPSQELLFINNAEALDILHTKAIQRFNSNARGLIESGFKRNPKAFHIRTDIEREIFISPEYADEIWNNRRLNTFSFTSKAFYGHIPTFELSRRSEPQDQIFAIAVWTKLTQSFGETSSMERNCLHWADVLSITRKVNRASHNNGARNNSRNMA